MHSANHPGAHTTPATPSSPATPAAAQPARLASFVQQLNALIAQALPEADTLAQGRALLAALVAHDDWLPADCAQPHPERYQQFLLHADPAGRFSVVSFVWGPGQATPIHNHTVWGLIGMLRGAELSQSYRQSADGRWQPDGAEHRLTPGQVEAVSPTIGDVHRVRNALADAVSVSIHVYGADIGQVQRNVFLEDGTRKPFVSGYSPRAGSFGAPVAG